MVESGSRNTRENAANTAALLGGEAKTARCLLVTSAFHMRRAMACFECVGLDCQPFATDHRGGSPGRFSPAYLIPDPSGFSTWQLFVKEWAGMLVYRIIGYC
ncbi:MAG: YdcF family protein [Verrucomicrobiales bacterium]